MAGMTHFEKEQYKSYVHGLDATQLVLEFVDMTLLTHLQAGGSDQEIAEDKARLLQQELLSRLTGKESK